MKLQEKIILISFVAAILIGLIVSGMDGSSLGKGTGLIVFAATAAIFGIVEVFFGLIMLLHPDKKYARSFLISGGIIFLIGFVTCTGGAFS